MSGTVDIIKERLSIVDVVGSYVQLQKSGKYFKARSPFTNERTPSFYVSPDRGLYHCFSTGKGGDIFTFVQEMEGVDFKGALKVLAERAGVELVPEDPKTRSERDQLFSILEAAAAWYQQCLSKKSDAVAYLSDRGLKQSSIDAWRIGFAPEGWHDLSQFLKRTCRATDAELEKAGLVIKGDKGYYDRFRSRIMFPISDSSGRVVGFSGRAYGADAEKGPKYMNSPETELFDKSSVLYGFHRAKQSIHRMGYAIVVEGQMDLVMSHQAGCTNTVASSGTALTERQLELVKRIAPRVLVAYDADTAGASASERAWQLALGIGMDIKIARLPKGKDPADLVRESVDAYKNALRDSVHVIDFKLENILRDVTDERQRARKIATDVVPYIAQISNPLEASYFAKRVGEQAGFAESIIWDQVKEAQRSGVRPVQTQQTQVPATAAETDASRDAFRRLYAIAWWCAEADASFDVQTIDNRLIAILGKEIAEGIRSALSIEKDKLIFHANTLYADTKPAVVVREIEDLLTKIEMDHLQRKRSDIMGALAGPPTPERNEQTLLQEYQSISRTIDELQAKMSN